MSTVCLFLCDKAARRRQTAWRVSSSEEPGKFRVRTPTRGAGLLGEAKARLPAQMRVETRPKFTMVGSGETGCPGGPKPHQLHPGVSYLLYVAPSARWHGSTARETHRHSTGSSRQTPCEEKLGWRASSCLRGVVCTNVPHGRSLLVAELHGLPQTPQVQGPHLRAERVFWGPSPVLGMPSWHLGIPTACRGRRSSSTRLCSSRG